MRLSLRFVLPLMLVLAGIAYAIAPLVDQMTLRWFVRDLDIRSSLIANTIQEPLPELLAAGKRTKIVEFFNRITQDERLFAVGYCASPTGAALASRSLPPEIRCGDLGRWEAPGDHLLPSTRGPLHVAVKSMGGEAAPAGRLVLVHDMSFVTRRSDTAGHSDKIAHHQHVPVQFFVTTTRHADQSHNLAGHSRFFPKLAKARFLRRLSTLNES